jgi:hypothetical protein
VWGLDLLGPFKKAPGGLTYLLVTVDKFTKWIEAKPLAKIGSKQVVDFIQDIVGDKPSPPGKGHLRQPPPVGISRS